MKRIVFTGGHHTSALVIAKSLIRRGYEIFWFGHKYTMRGVTNLSLEWQEINQAGIRFIDLSSGKIHQGGVGEWLRLIFGFFQAIGWLIKIKPKLIVSFGGYLAVPTVLAGFILRIPSITHEQTVVAGKANRFLQYFVKEVLITWPESKAYFPTKKTFLVGLPLRKEIVNPKKEVLFPRNKPMILITGGKQGSHIINQTVSEILPQLIKRFNVLHQTGETSTTSDFEKLNKLREQMTQELKKGYKIVKYLNNVQMGMALNQATCVVCRAGAHIIYDLLLLGKPAVLVPLSFSYADEQRKNAQKLVAAGSGKLIPQTELTGKRLEKEISWAANLSVGKLQSIKLKTKKLIILDAEARIIDRIRSLLE